METGLLVQVLLWGGLLLSIASEALRAKSANHSIVGFSLSRLKQSLPQLVLPALIPIVAGIVLQNYNGFSDAAFLVAGFLLPWALSMIIRLPAINGLLLLGAVWLLPMLAPAQIDNLPNINLALLSGFLLFHLIETIKPQAQDNAPASDARVLLPAVLWLIGSNWIQTAIPESVNTLILQGATATFLVLGAIFRLLPASSNHLLERFAKPMALALACAGGIGVLGDIVFHQPELTRWSWLSFASVIIGCYFASQEEDNQEDNKESLLNNIVNLALVGILMLGASRLFGTLGLIVAGLGVSLSHISRGKVINSNSIWQTAALFLLGRSLLQLFVYNFNPNVTGINITHPYASAALFGGITLMLCAQKFHRCLPTASTIAGWTIVALSACYYLHAEATGSLLVSSLFAAGAITLVPSITPNALAPQSRTALMLVTGWLISYCSLAAPWMELGNSATKTAKLLFLLLPLVVGIFIIKPLSKKPTETAA